jgi:hypothetical protein
LLTLFFTLAKDTGPQGLEGTERVITLPIALYFIPFAIMIPALYLVINNAHAVTRIAGYIRAELEPRSGLRWEGGLAKLYGKLGRERWGAGPLEESHLMFVVFVALAGLNALVFYYRGDWLGVRGWTEALLLLAPFLAFADPLRRLLDSTSCLTRYCDVWEAVVDRPQSPARMVPRD